MILKKILRILSIVYRNSGNPNNLSVLKQLLEMLKLRFFHGIGLAYYLQAGFYEKHIPWELKISHKSSKEYQKWLEKKNPILYRKISQNKLVESAVLKFMNIPTTKFVGFLHQENGIDVYHEPLTSLERFDAILRRINVSVIVIKPLEGYGGHGVRVFNVDLTDNVVTLADRATEDKFKLSFDNPSAHDLISNPEGWIIEEYFEQHSILADINPSSVNTIRMWANRIPGQATYCVSGYLRIGRKGSVVDNNSSGGFVCPVEHQTGILKKMQSGTPERIIHTHHPDHHAQIEGIQLPFWPECQLLAIQAMNAFPHMNFCGMDIAIGKDGPVIIELNPNPDKEGAAFMQILFPE